MRAIATRHAVHCAAVLVLCVGPAGAQDSPEDLARRALLERQQQSDAFARQLRQSQELLGVPAAQRPALERAQAAQRIEGENLDARQRESLRTLEQAAGGSPTWGPVLQVAPQILQRERDARGPQ